jgi:hypothetical protein
LSLGDTEPHALHGNLSGSVLARREHFTETSHLDDVFHTAVLNISLHAELFLYNKHTESKERVNTCAGEQWVFTATYSSDIGIFLKWLVLDGGSADAETEEIRSANNLLNG